MQATSPHPPRSPRQVVAVLGTAQTLSWASSYYLPAVLAAPIAADLGIGTPTVFAAFSLSLVVNALLGPWAGRTIDRRGGGPVLMATNLLFALGLVALGTAPNPTVLFAAWALLGVAMSAGLYESAFATLVGLYGREARNPITGITLIAGFASTVGWPLSAWMEARYGWRGACFGWAALHLVIGLPLNAWLPRAGQGRAPSAAATAPAAPAAPAASASSAGSVATVPSATTAVHAAPATAATAASHAAGASAEPAPMPPKRAAFTMALLSFVFSLTMFISTAMASHLPGLLQAAGASLAVAVGVGTLIGPAQVAGRLFEFGFLRRMHPMVSARLAALAHPVGVATLVVGGPAMAAAFAVLHGLGNGLLTIAKGTLPLALFGAHGYGARQGWLSLPARVSQASAPVLFGLALERWGAGALWLSAGLGTTAFAALLLLRTRHRAPA